MDQKKIGLSRNLLCSVRENREIVSSGESSEWGLAGASEDSPGILLSGIGVCRHTVRVFSVRFSDQSPPAPLVAIMSTSQCRSGDTEQITQQQLRVMPAQISIQSGVGRDQGNTGLTQFYLKYWWIRQAYFIILSLKSVVRGICDVILRTTIKICKCVMKMNV